MVGLCSDFIFGDSTFEVLLLSLFWKSTQALVHTDTPLPHRALGKDRGYRWVPVLRLGNHVLTQCRGVVWSKGWLLRQVSTLLPQSESLSSCKHGHFCSSDLRPNTSQERSLNASRKSTAADAFGIKHNFRIKLISLTFYQQVSLL